MVLQQLKFMKKNIFVSIQNMYKKIHLSLQISLSFKHVYEKNSNIPYHRNFYWVSKI